MNLLSFNTTLTLLQYGVALTPAISTTFLTRTITQLGIERANPHLARIGIYLDNALPGSKLSSPEVYANFIQQDPSKSCNEAIVATYPKITITAITAYPGPLEHMLNFITDYNLKTMFHSLPQSSSVRIPIHNALYATRYADMHKQYIDVSTAFQRMHSDPSLQRVITSALQWASPRGGIARSYKQKVIPGNKQSPALALHTKLEQSATIYYLNDDDFLADNDIYKPEDPPSSFDSLRKFLDATLYPFTLKPRINQALHNYGYITSTEALPTSPLHIEPDGFHLDREEIRPFRSTLSPEEQLTTAFLISIKHRDYKPPSPNDVVRPLTRIEIFPDRSNIDTMLIISGCKGEIIKLFIESIDEIDYIFGINIASLQNLWGWSLIYAMSSMVRLLAAQNNPHAVISGCVVETALYAVQKLLHPQTFDLRPIRTESEDKSIGDFIAKYLPTMLFYTTSPIAIATLKAALGVSPFGKAASLTVPIALGSVWGIAFSMQDYYPFNENMQHSKVANFINFAAAGFAGYKMLSTLNAHTTAPFNDNLSRGMHIMNKGAAALAIAVSVHKVSTIATHTMEALLYNFIVDAEEFISTLWDTISSKAHDIHDEL